MHICMCVCVRNVYMYACMYVCMYECIPVWERVRARAHARARVCVRMCVCECTRGSVYASAFVWLCLSTCAHACKASTHQWHYPENKSVVLLWAFHTGPSWWICSMPQADAVINPFACFLALFTGRRPLSLLELVFGSTTSLCCPAFYTFIRIVGLGVGCVQIFGLSVAQCSLFWFALRGTA